MIARLVGVLARIRAGRASPVLTLLGSGFVITEATGITGLYIGKVFDQVKDRPLYLVDRFVEEGNQIDAYERAEH